MPLAERRGACSRSSLSTSAAGGAALRDDAGVAVPVVRQLGDLAVADPVMIAARQAAPRALASTSPSCETGCRKYRPWQCDRVSACGSPRRRCRQAGAGIVNEHDENVGRVRRQPARLDAAMIDRLLHRAAGMLAEGVGGNGRMPRIVRKVPARMLRREWRKRRTTDSSFASWVFALHKHDISKTSLINGGHAFRFTRRPAVKGTLVDDSPHPPKPCALRRGADRGPCSERLGCSQALCVNWCWAGPAIRLDQRPDAT